MRAGYYGQRNQLEQGRLTRSVGLWADELGTGRSDIELTRVTESAISLMWSRRLSRALIVCTKPRERSQVSRSRPESPEQSGRSVKGRQDSGRATYPSTPLISFNFSNALSSSDSLSFFAAASNRSSIYEHYLIQKAVSALCLSAGR